MRQGKVSLDTRELLSRQEYLVVQGNDLARSFGKLKAFEHRILDYCFSLVKKDADPSTDYVVNIRDILRHLGLSDGGDNYTRVGKAFKVLNEQTALYLPIVENGVNGILMTQLFSRIKFLETGVVSFKFSEDSAPLVFDLKEKYYSFRLGELANIKGKYALILLKLWESNRHSTNEITTIKGTTDDWQTWFLADKRVSNSRFSRDMLERACEEIEEKIDCEIHLNKDLVGKTIVGYTITIRDNRSKRKKIEMP